MKQFINMSKNYKAAIHFPLKKTEFQRFKSDFTDPRGFQSFI